MTEHTNEPWEASDKTVYSDAFKSEKNKDGALACLVSSEENDWITVANTSRIVACVNALAGVDDPEAFMRDMREWREALSAYQEDESGDNLNNLARLDVVMSKHLKGGE